jgi:hypothetical protein
MSQPWCALALCLVHITCTHTQSSGSSQGTEPASVEDPAAYVVLLGSLPPLPLLEELDISAQKVGGQRVVWVPAMDMACPHLAYVLCWHRHEHSCRTCAACLPACLPGCARDVAACVGFAAEWPPPSVPTAQDIEAQVGTCLRVNGGAPVRPNLCLPEEALTCWPLRQDFI